MYEKLVKNPGERRERGRFFAKSKTATGERTIELITDDPLRWFLYLDGLLHMFSRRQHHGLDKQSHSQRQSCRSICSASIIIFCVGFCFAFNFVYAAFRCVFSKNK